MAFSQRLTRGYHYVGLSLLFAVPSNSSKSCNSDGMTGTFCKPCLGNLALDLSLYLTVFAIQNESICHTWMVWLVWMWGFPTFPMHQPARGNGTRALTWLSNECVSGSCMILNKSEKWRSQTIQICQVSSPSLHCQVTRHCLHDFRGHYEGSCVVVWDSRQFSLCFLVINGYTDNPMIRSVWRQHHLVENVSPKSWTRLQAVNVHRLDPWSWTSPGSQMAGDRSRCSRHQGGAIWSGTPRRPILREERNGHQQF